MKSCTFPMILSNPGLFPHRRSVTTKVESIDLFPTLADLYGIQRPLSSKAKACWPKLVPASSIQKVQSWRSSSFSPRNGALSWIRGTDGNLSFTI